VDCSKKAPLVLVLPGLTGNSQAEYIKSLMRASRSQGFRCVVLNNRGLGGVDLKVSHVWNKWRNWFCVVLKKATEIHFYFLSIEHIAKGIF